MFFLLRLLAALLLVSVLSPAPEAPADKVQAVPATYLPEAGPARLVIWKSQYTVTLYRGDTPVKTFHAVFGRGFADGDKERRGDKRTPEGDFYICTMNHSKRFYKFMGLSYPDEKHAEQALRSRLITPAEYFMIKKANEQRQQPPWDTPLGGAVGIHGRVLNGGAPAQLYTAMNWTDGCIALDNADIDEIFRNVSIGTPVTILP